MKRVLCLSWFRFLVALACLSFAANWAVAATAVIPSDADMIIGARAIVRGRVLSVKAGYDEQRGAVFSYVKLRVDKTFKGKIVTREITIKEPGGRAAGRITTVSGIPQFTPGEDVLVYLDTWADGSLRVYQWFLGKFQITSDGGEEIVSRDGAGDLASVQGEGFGGSVTNRAGFRSYAAMLSSYVQASADLSRQYEARYYKGVAIREQPREIGTIRLERNSSPSEVRWAEADENLPVSFSLNSEGAPALDVAGDVAEVLKAYSGAAGSSLRVLSGGGTAASGLYGAGTDNAISFVDRSGYSAFSPLGMLGRGGILSASSVTASTSETAKGAGFFRALRATISINPFAASGIAGDSELRQMLAREVGFALGLGKSDSIDSVLFPFNIARPGILTQSDVSRISTLYPADGRTPSLYVESQAQVSTQATAAATVGDDSYMTEQSVPHSVRVGQQFMPAIKWQNIGSTTWSQAGGYFIGSQSPAMNLTWGRASMLYPCGVTTPPGGVVNLVFWAIAPMTPGTYNFQWQLMWANHFIGRPSTAVSIIVLGDGTQPVIEGDGNLNAATGATFNYQMVASGGQGPYAWDVKEGKLPAGMTLNYIGGLLTGTPTETGTFNFTVQVTDVAGKTSTKPFTLTVSTPPLVISASAMAMGIVGTPYNQSLSAQGGMAPYTWSVASGALPAGVTLDPASGLISGTPTESGTFNFTVAVHDSAATAAATELQLVVVKTTDIPRISNVKFKAGGVKMVVLGENFSPSAVVVIDGVQFNPNLVEAGRIIKRPVSLAAGTHEIKVVNANGLASNVFVVNK